LFSINKYFTGFLEQLDVTPGSAAAASFSEHAALEALSLTLLSPPFLFPWLSLLSPSWLLQIRLQQPFFQLPLSLLPSL